MKQAHHRKKVANRVANRRPVAAPSPNLPQQPSSGSSSVIRKPRLIVAICVALIAMTLAVYAPVRHFDLLNWDDLLYITDNPHVANGLTWSGLKWAFTTGYTGTWDPLIWISFMLDVQLYGMNAGLLHVTNVLLHIANSLLLFGLLYQMTGALGRSAFVGALFAVHPLHVESVAWVAERKDVLSALFWIVTLWAYVWYARDTSRKWYLATNAFFTLSLL